MQAATSRRGFNVAATRLIGWAAPVQPHERRAVALAFGCNFVLLGSYYILRPLRDTVATLFSAAELKDLFTATFIGTLLVLPIFVTLAAVIKLKRLLPGVFFFWFSNVLLFWLLFALAPQNRWICASYY